MRMHRAPLLKNLSYYRVQGGLYQSHNNGELSEKCALIWRRDGRISFIISMDT
jgi:hypothetical protein